MSTEPEPDWMNAVCHTEGCPVNGQVFVAPCYPAPGSEPPVYSVVCGRCDQPITDLTPALPPGEGNV